MKRVYVLAAHLFLHEPKVSRNRNFSAFEDPRFQKALALDRRLRALLATLLRARAEGGRLRVDHGLSGGRPAVRILVELARGRQASVLALPEWRIFLSHPEAAACVQELAGEPA